MQINGVPGRRSNLLIDAPPSGSPLSRRAKSMERGGVGFSPISSTGRRFEMKLSIVPVESQKDYHARRKHHHYPRTTTSTVSSTTKSPVSTTTITVVEQVEDNQIPEVTRWPTTEPTETWEITTTSTTTTTTTTTMSTTPSTTTTTTTPPREYPSFLSIRRFLFIAYRVLRGENRWGGGQR